MRLSLDVADDVSVATASDVILEKFGGIDLFVNCPRQVRKFFTGPLIPRFLTFGEAGRAPAFPLP
jgi:hypothetical protein